jgi:tetrapyrrole methylase family protein/MazG family protein
MPPSILIVGLGPGSAEQLTREAWRALESAAEVYLRTRQHPSVAGLPAVAFHSFDAEYEAGPTLAEVYERIAQEVVALGERPAGVVYAVPGHPLVGEATVTRLLALAAERGLPTRIVAGVSILEPTFTALRLDPFQGLQIVEAALLAQKHHPNLDPDVGALVVQLHSRTLASEAKMTLLSLYPEEHPVRLVQAVGTAQETVREVALYALDRRDDLDPHSAVYLPPLATPGALASFQEVVARLRAPGGCPWDREQTHETLRRYLLEETYEVLSALDADDMEELKEELGDLLLQVFLHAQIATEEGDFRLIETVQHTIAKLIRRHPHVFGEATVQDSGEVLRNWEQIKSSERADKAATFTSMLSGISTALPALSQAMEMQRRAARVGFDWAEIAPVAAKVEEELREFREATTPAERAAELGDLLFSMVNLARWHEMDAESALRESSQRFARRFAHIERAAAQAGSSLDKMTLAEMDVLWEQAKGEEEGLGKKE